MPLGAGRNASRMWRISEVTGTLPLYNKFLIGMHWSRKKWVRSDRLPLISPEIQQQIARRNRMFERQTAASKQQRNKVTSLKRKGIKDFCSNATSNAKHIGECEETITP